MRPSLHTPPEGRDHLTMLAPSLPNVIAVASWPRIPRFSREATSTGCCRPWAPRRKPSPAAADWVRIESPGNHKGRRRTQAYEHAGRTTGDWRDKDLDDHAGPGGLERDLAGGDEDPALENDYQAGSG